MLNNDRKHMTDQADGTLLNAIGQSSQQFRIKRISLSSNTYSVGTLLPVSRLMTANTRKIKKQIFAAP
tara:strand:+ start:1341 stop:1544 length:204 start_codon:yes stop_codon:yes gene_type:complete